MATTPRGPRGTGFIDFGRYLSANAPQAQAMASRVADPIQQAGEGVERDMETAVGRAASSSTLLEDADKLGVRASEVAGKAKRLGSFGGVAAAVQDLGPKSSMYGMGANLLDAGLTGAAGGERFEGLRSKYGGLFGRVTDAAKEAQTRAAQPRPPRPPREIIRSEDPMDRVPPYKRDQLDELEDTRRGGRPRYNFLG